MSDEQILKIAERLLLDAKTNKPVDIAQVNSLNSIAASLLVIARNAAKPEIINMPIAGLELPLKPNEELGR